MILAFLLPSRAVPLTADDVMADVTSSLDYGSTLLTAATGPAKADALDQIILRQEEETKLFMRCL